MSSHEWGHTCGQNGERVVAYSIQRRLELQKEGCRQWCTRGLSPGPGIRRRKHRDRNTQHVTENVVYEGLKHYRGISQTKRHKHILEVTNWCVEGCLPLIFLSDSDKVVGVAEVLFSEDFVHDRGFGRRDRLEGEDTCSCGCSLVMFFSPW